MMGAGNIGELRARLEASHTVVDALVVAWDIFDLVQVVANGCADRDPGWFAAFLFAAAAAAEGRDAAGFAPSTPDCPGMPLGEPGWGTAGVGEIAAQVAALMGVLGGKLELAAGLAADRGDHGRVRTRPGRPARFAPCSHRVGDDGSYLRRVRWPGG
jgi:hypothetical protein